VINVPAKAKVRIVPMWRKKLPCKCSVCDDLALMGVIDLMQFIARSQNDRRKEQVEKESVIEGN